MLEPRPTPRPALLPGPVRAVLDGLRGAGHQAVLVGGCVRDLLRGVPVADFDVATSAPPEAVLALFPHAVPTGLRHGTVMIPTRAAPIDVTTFRAGPRLEDDLAHRDFTVNAIAWDPGADHWLDPFGGADDLRARRLRAVGSARARFAEDALRALRAARLVAGLGLRPDAEIEAAMAEARVPLRSVARERVRRELEALLLAPEPARGLALLRASGIEADLAPGSRADAPEVVAALPALLDLRLAGWLRGTRVEGVLATLRFGRRRAVEIGRLVARHPIDGQPLRSDADLRRLLNRYGAEGVEALLRLREAELDAAFRAPGAGDRDACSRIAALRLDLERVKRRGALALQRGDLALDGRAVMQLLGRGPGPHVGEALQLLTECVIEDPACNTRERLAERLRAWHAQPRGERSRDHDPFSGRR